MCKYITQQVKKYKKVRRVNMWDWCRWKGKLMTHYVGLLQMKEEIHNTYPNLWQHGWSWYHKDWQLWSTQTVMWQTSQTRDHRQSTDRHTYSSIVENLGIATVWIFATQLPDIKEGLPVDVGSKSWDVVVLQHSATEERRCNSTHNHSSHCSGPATLIHTKMLMADNAEKR